jgi:hypothetical protein
MRRARESDDLEEERPKKQANLGLFFRQADGSPLTPPAPPQLHRLSCPYCELSLESQHHASLPGSLRAHVQWRHPDDFFEASTRLQAALSSARGSIFDIVAMPPIPEEERVFLDQEVSASDSSSDEELYRRRSVRRRRWCLSGCDCERPVGSRKCSCERTGDNFCGANCACDPALCRSRWPADDSDAEGGGS